MIWTKYALILGLTLLSASAGAQTAPRVDAAPERTTASFGDWTLICERPQVPAGAPRLCELRHGIQVQVQGQTGTIAQVAIGRTQRSDPLRITLVLPNNVTLTSGPKFAAEDKGGQVLETAWQRCLPAGCFANLPLKDDVFRKILARTEPGRLEFKDGTGKDVVLPLSWRGLSQAVDALGREKE